MRRLRLRRGDRGVSLPELLVVIAILALGILVSVPLVSEKILDTRLRVAASQFSTSLRAARMIAVSRSRTVTVEVEVDPANHYLYEDAKGRTRSVPLPAGVIFVSSPAAIIFKPNGSIQATQPAETILELDPDVGEVRKQYVVTTSLSGIPSVVSQPVGP